MKTHTFDYDLIVIGSGAGGSIAATIASRDGLRVALIEEDALGGDSSNWGDIPTKALLHAAHLYGDAKKGDRFGLRTTSLGYNYPSLRAWKEKAVKQTGVGGNKKFYENQGVSVIVGKAHFLTPHEITVNRRHLSGNRFLVATGSTWVAPHVQGLDSVAYLTPRTILEALRPPKSLLILGGSRYGVEIADLMATFGTKVYILEENRRLLPEFEPEVGDYMEATLGARKEITVLTSSKPLSVTKEGESHRVLFTRGGAQKHVKVDAIMVAANYLPNVDIGLGNALVEYSEKGIPTDANLRTNVKHIYAAGDVLGHKQDTHAALIESRVVAHNVLGGTKISPDYTAMPKVVFSSPEVAQVGLTEQEAKRTHNTIRRAVAPLHVVARSNVSDHTDGFVKLIANKQGVILGGVVVGPHATDIIHEISLAVRYGLTAQQLAATPHVFLSWAEAIRVTAQKLIGATS